MLGISTRKSENVQFQVGDRIQLAEGGTGVVKYVGGDPNEENDTEPIIGVELDRWDPNANDGKFKGRPLFNTKMGRGMFTRRQSVLQVLPSKANDLPHLKELPDKGDRVRLRSGEEGIVQKIVDDLTTFPPQKEIQIAFLDSSNSGVPNTRLVTLGELSENLGKYYDERYASLQNKQLNIKVGDHVRLLRGKTGIIKYIGPVGEESELIGIELDLWNPSAHNGKGVFQAANGRGFFTKRSAIVEIIEKPEEAEQAKIQTQRYRQMRYLKKKLYKIEHIQIKPLVQRQLNELREAFNRSYPSVEIDDIVKRESTIESKGSGLPLVNPKPELKEGDKVVLDTGETGKIIFIGWVNFDEREMLGILLDNWSPNGHEGTVDGVQYFSAPEGRGLMVPFESVVGLYDESKHQHKRKKPDNQQRQSMELEPVKEEETEDIEDKENEEKMLEDIPELEETSETKEVYEDLPKLGERIDLGGTVIYLSLHFF
ncbi:hypothetical protein RFI_06886 [Reticulomyxa filosa]|uniref:CAP-Gly domain-containing protein n=1 Tax=Reticulomyxa filosa TaxID=46433 RepID=X6NV99_RETFI|nr:hypothetical protein RFI_06886 [Reticulomyxa filosa]|eukprot:ETO30235.1 hypothetical protein RFI_06886 [Reticulomyxa filosa]